MLKQRLYQTIYFCVIFSVLFTTAAAAMAKAPESNAKALTAQPPAEDDFTAVSEAIKKKTSELLEKADRKEISPDFIKIVERAYPKLPMRNILTLPMKYAVSKDDLWNVYLRPKDGLLVAACDKNSKRGTIYILSDRAFYVIAPKAMAACLGKADMYNAFDGDPFFYVIPYQQLASLSIGGTDSYMSIMTPEGTLLKIPSKTGIPSCLRAAIKYLKEKDSPSDKPKKPLAKLDFVKGHNLIVPYLTKESTADLRDAMEKLAQTNADYVCLAIMADMETFNSTEIKWGEKFNYPDEMLLETIKIARQNNLKIIIKPMINPKDNVWRAWIEFTDDNGERDLAAWQQWWKQYNDYILHYVMIAEQTNCEMVCLGCELTSTETFQQKWLALINKARKLYSGMLTYNVNHGGAENVLFWDKLDVIGMSGYYYLGGYMEKLGIEAAKQPHYDAKLSDLLAAWKVIRKELKTVSDKWKKPLFFIECGLCSAENVARTPWQHSSPDLVYDGQEQADFYQAVLESFWDEPWFAGFVWWSWPPKMYPREKAETLADFPIYGKPAEDVVKKWYIKDRPFDYNP